ncbi:unnamed protein product [Amoebophrya sp. A120]|nr:unnamed protein product [Amoebophrya sp. A120]|eukprot:GSA120T00023774001.1
MQERKAMRPPGGPGPPCFSWRAVLPAAAVFAPTLLANGAKKLKHTGFMAPYDTHTTATAVSNDGTGMIQEHLDPDEAVDGRREHLDPEAVDDAGKDDEQVDHEAAWEPALEPDTMAAGMLEVPGELQELPVDGDQEFAEGGPAPGDDLEPDLNAAAAMLEVLPARTLQPANDTTAPGQQMEMTISAESDDLAAPVSGSFVETGMQLAAVDLGAPRGLEAWTNFDPESNSTSAMLEVPPDVELSENATGTAPLAAGQMQMTISGERADLTSAVAGSFLEAATSIDIANLRNWAVAVSRNGHGECACSADVIVEFWTQLFGRPSSGAPGPVFQPPRVPGFWPSPSIGGLLDLCPNLLLHVGCWVPRTLSQYTKVGLLSGQVLPLPVQSSTDHISPFGLAITQKNHPAVMQMLYFSCSQLPGGKPELDPTGVILPSNGGIPGSELHLAGTAYRDWVFMQAWEREINLKAGASRNKREYDLSDFKSVQPYKKIHDEQITKTVSQVYVFSTTAAGPPSVDALRAIDHARKTHLQNLQRLCDANNAEPGSDADLRNGCVRFEVYFLPRWQPNDAAPFFTLLHVRFTSIRRSRERLELEPEWRQQMMTQLGQMRTEFEGVGISLFQAELSDSWSQNARLRSMYVTDQKGQQFSTAPFAHPLRQETLRIRERGTTIGATAFFAFKPPSELPPAKRNEYPDKIKHLVWNLGGPLTFRCQRVEFGCLYYDIFVTDSCIRHWTSFDKGGRGPQHSDTSQCVVVFHEAFANSEAAQAGAPQDPHYSGRLEELRTWKRSPEAQQFLQDATHPSRVRAFGGMTLLDLSKDEDPTLEKAKTQAEEARARAEAAKENWARVGGSQARASKLEKVERTKEAIKTQAIHLRDELQRTKEELKKEQRRAAEAEAAADRDRLELERIVAAVEAERDAAQNQVARLNGQLQEAERRLGLAGQQQAELEGSLARAGAGSAAAAAELDATLRKNQEDLAAANQRAQAAIGVQKAAEERSAQLGQKMEALEKELVAAKGAMSGWLGNPPSLSSLDHISLADFLSAFRQELASEFSAKDQKIRSLESQLQQAKAEAARLRVPPIRNFDLAARSEDGDDDLETPRSISPELSSRTRFQLIFEVLGDAKRAAEENAQRAAADVARLRAVIAGGSQDASQEQLEAAKTAASEALVRFEKAGNAEEVARKLFEMSEQLARDLEKAQESHENLEAELAEARSATESAKLAEAQLTEQAKELQRNVAEREAECEKLLGGLAEQDERLAQEKTAGQQAAAQLQQLSNGITEKDAKIAELRAQLDALKGEKEAANTAHRNALEGMARSTTEQERLAAALQAHEQQVEQLNAFIQAAVAKETEAAERLRSSQEVASARQQQLQTAMSMVARGLHESGIQTPPSWMSSADLATLQEVYQRGMASKLTAEKEQSDSLLSKLNGAQQWAAQNAEQMEQNFHQQYEALRTTNAQLRAKIQIEAGKTRDAENRAAQAAAGMQAAENAEAAANQQVQAVSNQVAAVQAQAQQAEAKLQNQKNAKPAVARAAASATSNVAVSGNGECC